MTPVLMEFESPCEDGAKAESKRAPSSADGAEPHVPGSRATTVDVSQLWGGLPRHVLRSGTSLAAFLRSFLGNQPWKHRGTALPLWPIAAPYPGCFSGANAEVNREQLSLQKAVNVAVLTLSWLHLGRPSRCPGSLSLTTTLSSKQWEVVRRLELHLKEVQEAGVVDAAQMGRSAAKVEGLENLLTKLQDRAEVLTGDRYLTGSSKLLGSSLGPSSRGGTVVGQLSAGTPVLAKEIQTDRLSLPSDPPSFDPTDLLPPKHRRVFLNPLAHAEPVDPAVDSVPKVRVHARPAEVHKLLQRLDASGRIHLAAREEVRETLLCGAFALVKDADNDRLILDARPPNAKEQTLDAWCKTLASPFTLALKELEPHQVAYFSGTDLKDYYHAFKVTKARARRNALAVSVSRSFASELSGYHEGLVAETRLYPCVSALAMGDCQAVEIGQLAHIQLGLVARAFSPHELVAVHGRAPRGALAAGIVIDDVILAEFAAPNMDSSTLESVQRLNRLCEEYVQRGLLAHPRKTFRAQHRAEFWGCSADGLSGHLRAAPRRLVPLMELSVRTARLRHASMGLLETLTGAWVAILQVRRRTLCLLQALYEAQRGRAQSDIIALSDEAVEELYLLTAIGPLAVVEMRAPSLPEVYMSDASEWGTASVRAAVPVSLTREFQRHTLSRGAWAKLLTPWKAWLRSHQQLFEEDELPSGVPLVSHPLWLLLARCLKFDINHVRRSRSKKHINLLELQSVLEVEKRLAERRGSCRYLLGSDSQVTLAALTKGRSASPWLNRMLQQSLPTLLGAGLYGLYGYIPSLTNPSDDPTRGVALRDPVEMLPPWWDDALRGDFAAMDAWLASLGFDPLSLAEVPLAEEDTICAAALDQELLAKLREVQKPERMKKFLDGESGPSALCTDQANDNCTVPVNENDSFFPCTVSSFAFSGNQGREFQRVDQAEWRNKEPGSPNKKASEKSPSRPAIMKGPTHSVASTNEQGATAEKPAVHSVSFAVDAQDSESSLSDSSADLFVGESLAKASPSFPKQKRGSGKCETAQGESKQDGEKKPQKKVNERPSQAVVSPTLLSHGRGRKKKSKKCTGPLGLPLGRPARQPWCSRATVLPEEALALLRSFKPNQFFWPDGKRGSVLPPFDCPGFLDLYSGKAGVARSLASTFGCWVLSIDWDHGADEDLLAPDLQRRLLRLLELGAFVGVGAAPDCSSFSRAVTPAVRSRAFIF